MYVKSEAYGIKRIGWIEIFKITPDLTTPFNLLQSFFNYIVSVYLSAILMDVSYDV